MLQSSTKKKKTGKKVAEPDHGLLMHGISQAQVEIPIQVPSTVAIPDCYRWNLLPTFRGQERLNHLATARKESLRLVEGEIAATKKAIENSNAEILNLEATISRSSHAASLMEKCSESIKTIRNETSCLDDIPKTILASATGLKSFDMCEAIARLVGNSSSDEFEAFGTLMSEWSTNAAKMKAMIVEMQKELLDWRLEHALDSGHLSQLEDYHHSLMEIINTTSAVMSPIRRTPTEVWAKIFDYWVHDRDLVASHHNLPSPLLLGHVCSVWRQICLSTPSLWRRVDIHPFDFWPQSLLDIVTLAQIAGSGQSLDYVFFDQFRAYWGDEAQDLSFNGSFYPEYYQSVRRDLAQSKGKLANLPRLRLYLSPSAPLTVPTLSVNSTKKLTLCGNSAPRDHDLAALLTLCVSAEELVMENVWLTSTSSVSMPKLKCLRLRINRFESFNISALLEPSLQELDIRHADAHSSIMCSTNSALLTNLRKLAVTPHEHSLLSHLMTPNLKQVKIYPPNSTSAAEASRPDSTRSVVESFVVAFLPRLQKVEEVTFCEWPKPSLTADYLDVLKSMLSASSPRH
ncbi:hypothetical protein PIIN_09092, partial [Serendipita indica DSM 11827]